LPAAAAGGSRAVAGPSPVRRQGDPPDLGAWPTSDIRFQ